MTQNKLWEKLKLKAKALKRQIAALYLAYKRKDVPVLAKILILITIGYALSPIDLIPDFIPILGYLDDILILPFLVYISMKLIPRDIMEACKEQAKSLWEKGKPKKWYYAIPVIIVYLLIIILVVKRLLR